MVLTPVTLAVAEEAGNHNAVERVSMDHPVPDLLSDSITRGDIVAQRAPEVVSEAPDMMIDFSTS